MSGKTIRQRRIWKNLLKFHVKSAEEKKKKTGQVAGGSFLIAHISLCILSKIGSNLLSYLVLLALGSRDSVSSKPDVKSCLFLFLILRV